MASPNIILAESAVPECPYCLGFGMVDVSTHSGDWHFDGMESQTCRRCGGTGKILARAAASGIATAVSRPDSIKAAGEATGKCEPDAAREAARRFDRLEGQLPQNRMGYR